MGCGMSLPTGFTIFGNDITVKGVRNLTDHDGTGCEGLFHPDKNLIEINTVYCEDSQMASLWHEIMHAILDCHGISLSKDETFVEAIGQSMWQVTKTWEE